MLHDHSFRNVRIWPRGIDMSIFSPSHRSESLRLKWSSGVTEKQGKVNLRDTVVITYVGRLSSEKNIDLLLNAFIQLKDSILRSDAGAPECRLVLVGEGPARGRLEEQTCGLDVVFTGYQTGKALAECFASSDIFAFPSHSETFGNVVLEAMASGLPVVGLRAEGVSDLVESGKSGFLLDLDDLPGAKVSKGASGIPSNVQQLFTTTAESYDIATGGFAQLLRMLVLDTKMRRKMSQAAIEYAATRTWDQAMNCLLEGECE
jgi:glycosyltransferase involved in cell wall biosynthesis